MSLALPPTLAEIRQATLTRCGLATEGNIPRAIQDIIDERIRDAQSILYENSQWLRTLVERQIEVQDGVTDYDVPDDTEPGKIEAIGIRRIEDGYIFRLEPGMRLGEDNITKPTLNAAYPMRYTFIDQIIRVKPPPASAYYDVFILQYRQVPNALRQDSDRVVVDDRAVKMLAEALVKEHFGGQDTRQLREDLREYVEAVRADQSDGDGLQMGGRISLIAQTQRRNRFVNNLYTGSGDWRAWRPW